MTCDEKRTVAYLAGDLDPDEAAAYERHLLGCESCWTAVRDDRRGRELAEQLRELAPSGLRDRVRANIELAAGSRPGRHRAPLRTILAIAAAVVVLAGAGAFFGLRGGGDPAVINDVLKLASSSTAPSTAAHMYGGHRVEFTMEHMDGEPVVLARSDAPFPMPANAMPLGKSHGEPWMAHRHDMTLLSLSHPSHVLLVSRMPPERLLDFARAHGLSP